MTLKEIVKLQRRAEFEYAIAGTLYYTINDVKAKVTFPVDMNDKEDVGTATFCNSYKPITLMRYIRKAIDNDTIIIIPKEQPATYSATVRIKAVVEIIQDHTVDLDSRDDELAKKRALENSLSRDDIESVIEEAYSDADGTSATVIDIEEEVLSLKLEEDEEED